MSGTAQGIPQRLTAFVDPQTGMVSDTWWRFLQTIWQRSGGAQPTTSTDDLIRFVQMADVPAVANPEPAAWLGAALGDVPLPSPIEPAVWLAVAAGDVPRVPENDPMLVALMVA